jgi:uncharacterized membrane protein
MRQIISLKTLSSSKSLLVASSKGRGGNNMTRFAGRICSMGCMAPVLCAFALTFMVPSSGALGFTFTTIDVPGAPFTDALGINARGQIVGSYADVSFTGHGYLLDKGTFTTIDVPGTQFTRALGINARGQIVGEYQDVTVHGYLLDKGTFTTIDVPGAPFTSASGINARGQIVGSYLDVSFTYHGYLLDKGTFTTIDVPGAPLFTRASGINDRGQIVGSYADVSFTGHGFVAQYRVLPATLLDILQ